MRIVALAMMSIAALPVGATLSASAQVSAGNPQPAESLLSAPAGKPLSGGLIREIDDPHTVDC